MNEENEQWDMDKINALPEFIVEDHLTSLGMVKGYILAFTEDDVTLEELKMGLESALKAKVFEKIKE